MRLSTTTNLKKGDNVAVRAGKDKGKNGKIISVDRKSGRIIVEGINILHKFEKKKPNTPGQKISFPAAMTASKVILICPSCGKPSRISHQVLENGKKQRICKKCGKAI
ncbi:MAG: ribosomal protein [Candidatus Doudnabacteria bacterium]|nr:ribosomal protein [Candidatus Doudnabacteria bacterium]